MHKFILVFAILATVSMSSIAEAQRGGQRGERGGQRGGQRGDRGGQRPVSPMMAALDADKDGKLSAEEIKNAAVALKSLDKNEDGVLDASELAPPRGGRGGGRGGDPSARIDRIMERDADKDGKLSKEEGGEQMARMFEFADGDKDGFLTRTELEEMAKRFGGGRGGRGGGNRTPAPKAKDNRPDFDDN